MWLSHSSWTSPMYMLLHPCECNIWFTSTEPKGHRPEGEVLVNQILHERGCNNKFISHWSYTVYTLRSLEATWGCEPKWRIVTMTVKIRVISLQKNKTIPSFLWRKGRVFMGKDDGSVLKEALLRWRICQLKGTRCTVSHQRATQCTVSTAVHCIRFTALAVPLKYSLNGK